MSLKEAIRWFFRDASPGAQRARRATKLLVLLALFIFLFSIIPFQQVIQAMLNADPFYMALGLLLGFLSLALTAVQLEPLTRNQGIHHSVGTILAINLAVKFYNQFTPSTLLGSGYRWYRLAQPGGKVVEALVALGFFRVMETFLTFAIGLSFFLISGSQMSLQLNVGWLVLIVVGIVVFWVLVTRYSLKMYEWLKIRDGGRLEKEPWKTLTRRIEKLLHAVTAYADMPAFDLLFSITAGLLSAFSGIASGVCLARSLGIELTFIEMGWIQAVILIVTQLPFTVANGLGVREVTLVAILSTFGVSADLALALSFLMFIRGVLLSLLGGMIEALDAIRNKRSPTHIRSTPGDIKKL